MCFTAWVGPNEEFDRCPKKLLEKVVEEFREE
jgi:hypothetical protein